MQRVLVIGSSGAGKTRFARQLAAALALPCVELDALFWGPQWRPRPRDEFRADVAQAAGGKAWVIDGNYGSARALLWPRADTVVWLDYGLATVFWRVLRRTLRRAVTREPLWQDNRESLQRALLSRDSILWWTLSTYRRRRSEFAQLRAQAIYPQLEWVVLRRPGEVEAILGRARASTMRAPPQREEAPR